VLLSAERGFVVGAHRAKIASQPFSALAASATIGGDDSRDVSIEVRPATGTSCAPGVIAGRFPPIDCGVADQVVRHPAVCGW